MFGILRSWKRRRLLAPPFPESRRQILRANVGWYHLLTPTEQRKLERDATVFIAEKNWEGCAGLDLTDEIKVTIAGQACLLVLAWDDYLFERVRSILVYPAVYRPRRRGSVEVDDELPEIRLGETFGGETVVLSWRDALRNARGSAGGDNVILHEFAHVLDMETGESDGIPIVASEAEYFRWKTELTRLLAEGEYLITRRRPTFLDPYAYTNAAELFAVATEAFFESAPAFQQAHGELYGLLANFYRQDPATRYPQPPA